MNDNDGNRREGYESNERQQRELQLLRREEQTQRQMELLQNLVQGVQQQEAVSRRAERIEMLKCRN